MTAPNLMRAAILSFGLFMVWPAGATQYAGDTCDTNIKRITHPDYVCTDIKDWPSEVKDVIDK